MFELILPITLIAGGLLSGIIFERTVLPKIKHVIVRTQWEGAEISVNALRGVSWLWFGIAGIYAAIQIAPLAPRLAELGQNMLLVVAILSVTLALSKIAAGLVGLYVRRSDGILPSASIFTNLTRLLIFLVGILVVLQSLGISITPILTALGVGGLAVALALQDTLSNLFAGLHILASRQIKPGDYIKLDTGEEGYITDITWRNTTIRALPNNSFAITPLPISVSISRSFCAQKNSSINI